ncbi:MAG: hypothetical protein ACYCXQ_08380 [Candidatus Humimicrobiaceae bacterium]
MSVNTLAVSKNTQEYRCRKPQYSPYYQCIEDNYEAFERSYDAKYQEKFGYFRPVISNVIYQYLDCGILHNGFARVKCIWGAPHMHFILATPNQWKILQDI